MTVIGNFYLCERWIYRTGDPEICRSGVLAGVGDRLLGDA
jgi:hypothetical protein